MKDEDPIQSIIPDAEGEETLARAEINNIKMKS
jgi:hypothetical protein